MDFTPRNIFDNIFTEITQLQANDRLIAGRASAPNKIAFVRLPTITNALINVFQGKNARLSELANLVEQSSPQNIRLRSNGSLELRNADYDQTTEPTGLERFNGAIWRERNSSNFVIGVWQWSSAENVWRNFFLVNQAATRGSSSTVTPVQPIAQEFAVYSINTKLDSSGQSRRITL